MSEVISFRLNKDNPREAQALEILKAWCLRGYSVRYLITEMLLMLNDPGQESMTDNAIRELNSVLNQVNKLLEKIENSGYLPYSEWDENPEQLKLAGKFVASIREVVKNWIEIRMKS